jgi:cytochrome c
VVPLEHEAQSGAPAGQGHRSPAAGERGGDPGRLRFYNEACVYCHGAPGKDPTDIGKGLNPEPPYLPDVVARWSSAEPFWIAKNGIRMTGMPAFGSTHKDEEIWKVVAFVQRLPMVTEGDYVKIGTPVRGSRVHPGPAGRRKPLC